MKTSKDFMEWLGLQVGDKVKTDITVVEVKESVTGTIYLKDIEDNEEYQLSELIDIDIEILPRPKRVGDLKCGTQGKDGQNTCGDCPVRFLCEHHSCNEFGAGDTLYDYLNAYYDYYTLNEGFKGFDQEIYDLLKARLDKEVE